MTVAFLPLGGHNNLLPVAAAVQAVRGEQVLKCQITTKTQTETVCVVSVKKYVKPAVIAPPCMLITAFSLLLLSRYDSVQYATPVYLSVMLGCLEGTDSSLEAD